VARAAHQRDERDRTREGDDGKADPDAEREPQRLRGDRARVLLAPGSVQARDLGRRPVREEVAQDDREREDAAGDGEGRELRRSEVADDGGVDQEVERLGGQDDQRRNGE
jgi:hypothetical protein